MGGNWVAVSQLRSYRNIIQIPCKIRNHREVKYSSRRSEVCVILVNRRIEAIKIQPSQKERTVHLSKKASGLLFSLYAEHSAMLFSTS